MDDINKLQSRIANLEERLRYLLYFVVDGHGDDLDKQIAINKARRALEHNPIGDR
jgi:hypothetical protein